MATQVQLQEDIKYGEATYPSLCACGARVEQSNGQCTNCEIRYAKVAVELPSVK